MGNKHKFHGYKNQNSKMDNREEKETLDELQPEEINSEETGKDSSDPEAVVSTEEKVAEETQTACDEAEKKVTELEAELAKEKKEYLFLMAEFDNFRKRTLKEKSEIIKNAGENVFKGLLPILDDFERGIKAAENSPEGNSVKEGVTLIYNKLKKYLEQNGVKEIDPNDDTFDTERHEAISVVPVPDEEKKGKILDTIEKGYTINDKVLRHAKVVVGQ